MRIDHSSTNDTKTGNSVFLLTIVNFRNTFSGVISKTIEYLVSHNGEQRNAWVQQVDGVQNGVV